MDVPWDVRTPGAGIFYVSGRGELSAALTTTAALSTLHVNALIRPMGGGSRRAQ